MREEGQKCFFDNMCAENLICSSDSGTCINKIENTTNFNSSTLKVSKRVSDKKISPAREKRALQAIRRTPPPPPPPSRTPTTYRAPTTSTYRAPTTSRTTVSTYVYTYSSRRYCTAYKQYYYSSGFYCPAGSAGGAVGGGVGGGVAFVIVLIVIFVIWKKK
jgi:hypothetical protein